MDAEYTAKIVERIDELKREMLARAERELGIDKIVKPPCEECAYFSPQILYSGRLIMCIADRMSHDFSCFSRELEWKRLGYQSKEKRDIEQKMKAEE